jgi:hypothetical protein
VTAIGFDPGSRKTAYAVLERRKSGRVVYVVSGWVENGAIALSKDTADVVVVEKPFAVRLAEALEAAEFGGWVINEARLHGVPVVRFGKPQWAKKLFYPTPVTGKKAPVRMRNNVAWRNALEARLRECVYGLPPFRRRATPDGLTEHELDAVALAWCGLAGAKE